MRINGQCDYICFQNEKRNKLNLVQAADYLLR